MNSNFESVFEAVKEFSNDAELDYSEPLFDKNTIVIESGHQPNFLPHAGLFKKLFLMNFFKRKYYDQGKNVITLFGFADYNLSTARILTQNKLPILNKLGYQKIGFKISNKNRWKRFDFLPKPEEKEWNKEIEKIVSYYRKYSVSIDLNKTIDIINYSYKYAKNFPDLNAFFISKICNEILGLNIYFFRYSDIQKKRIFLNEWKKIISNLSEYNKIYNNTINKYHLKIPLCEPNSFPFWYHCECGAKVNLNLEKNNATGVCASCLKNHVIDIDNLETYFDNMSPNAVSRNIVFSEGLGTNLFISGTGGGLVYGKISDEISKQLGFHLPKTISWKSKDYYMGFAYKDAIIRLKKICGISEKISNTNINKIINNKKIELLEMIEKTTDKKEKKKYLGQYKNLNTMVSTIKAIFNTTPSFIDIIASYEAKEIIDFWNYSLKDINEERIIIKDVIYDKEILEISKKLKEI